MKEEVTIKTCDICKQQVKMFCDEQPYNGYLNIARKEFGSSYGGAEPLDICLKCNEKIINFIDSLHESNKSF
jgi:hypothetical protein